MTDSRATKANARIGVLFRIALITVAFGFAVGFYLDLQEQLALTLRIIVIVSCVISVVALLIGFVRYRGWWNEKTRDYWFGRIAWCVGGIISCTESIVRHTPFRYATIFFVVAALVTLKGTLQRGSWGTPPDATTKDRYTG